MSALHSDVVAFFGAAVDPDPEETGASRPRARSRGDEADSS